jgi:hypothetical protein
MKFRFLLFVAMVCLPLFLGAQNDTLLLYRIRNNRSLLTDFSRAPDFNPAARAFSGRSSLHQMHIGGHRQSGNAGIRQQGTGQTFFTAEAESFIRHDGRFIWGNASYRNGQKDGVEGNETSDFSTVYPYVMMDSIGRNNLNYEQYAFSGGYAQRLSLLSWGMELAYRALMEYRTQDPRPDNIASDLRLNGGVHYRLFSCYTLGAGFHLRKYKQRNELHFYSLLGAPKIVHYTGLGTDAYMFAGNNMRTRFQGAARGINIQLLPVDRYGLSATLGYSNFSFEKIMSDFQNLPIADVNEDTYTTVIAYLWKRDKYHMGVRLQTEYKDRKGTEYKFHSPQYGNYEKIAEERLFGNKTNGGKLEFLYENHAHQNWVWHIAPHALFFKMEESHRNPSRKMDFSRLSAGADMGFSKMSGRSLWQVNGELTYQHTLRSTLNVPGLKENSFAGQLLHNNYRYLASNGVCSRLSLQWDYLLKQNRSMNLKISWYNQSLKKYFGNCLTMTVGVSF